MSDRNLIDRATLAYHRRCVLKGFIFNQPNAGLSEVDGDIIFLRNCNGVLARYRITAMGPRFVEDSGAEDQTNE